MKKLKYLILILFIILAAGCEKDDPFADSTQEASIVGFYTEKCYCCWGWIIKIGDQTIRAEEIPGILYTQEPTFFPINGKIKIGRKIIECDKYEFDDDYYEILEFKTD